MSSKLFLFKDEARLKLLEGLEQLANLINPTLGPKGNHVALDKSVGSPKITSDSSSILEEVELKDQFANLAINLAQSMASQIKETTGDGVTTGLILLNQLAKEGIKQISAGYSPIFLKRGLEKGLTKILETITSMVIPVKTEEEIKRIATVAASGDSEVGTMIAESFQRVGVQGVISIEEGKGLENKLELVEGLEIERGYLSPYFCTNAEKMLVEMENPYILITDKKLSSIQELLPLLQNLNAVSGELLIIAEEIEGDALATLVINKLKQILKVAAIKAPSFGEERKEILEDLAILTQGAVIAEERGLTLLKTNLNHLGRAEKIVISKEKTTIINGRGQKSALEKRIKQLEAEKKLAHNSYDQEKLSKRSAKLKGGVAIIKVGAASDVELKHKKRLFEESLAATKAALEEGLIVGGGVALARAAQELEKLDLGEEERAGAMILKRSLFEPIKILMQNSGLDPHVYLEKILSSTNPHLGFNVETEELCNLLQAGIFDPAKVVKNSLKQAVITANLLLFSEVLIGDNL